MSGLPALTMVALSFVALRTWLRRWCQLPNKAYGARVVLLEIVRRHPRALATLALPAVPLLLSWRELNWSTIAIAAPWLRPFIVTITLVTAVECGLYRYNQYFDRGHLVDRFAVLLLGALT